MIGPRVTYDVQPDDENIAAEVLMETPNALVLRLRPPRIQKTSISQPRDADEGASSLPVG